jgi:hypothetical protein
MRVASRRLLLCAVLAVLLLVLSATGAQAAPFVYIGNSTSNSVSQFGVGAGGLLSPLVPPTVTASFPNGIVVRPACGWDAHPEESAHRGSGQRRTGRGGQP